MVYKLYFNKAVKKIIAHCSLPFHRVDVREETVIGIMVA